MTAVPGLIPTMSASKAGAISADSWARAAPRIFRGSTADGVGPPLPPGRPTLRTLFGTKHRRINRGGDLSPRLGVVIETPRHDLTLFKVHFGLLTLKGYTK